MWDEAEYANLGRDLYRGDVYGSSFRPPVLPLAVAATMALTGSSQDSVLKSPQILFAALALGLVYWALWSELGVAAATVAVGCLGSAPFFWLHTSFLLTEMPFMAFFAGACFCFYSGLYRSQRWFYLAWAFTGLAFLTRYTCVLLGPLFVLFVILGLFLDRATVAQKLKTRAFWLAPLVGLAVQAPWLVRQAMVYGDALTGFRYASGQLQRYAPGVSMPLSFYFVNLPTLLSWPVLILASLGFLWVLKEKDPFGLHCLVVVAFLLLWFSAYRYKELRLVTAMVPFFAASAGVAYGRLGPKLWKGFKTTVPALVVVAALAMVSYVSWRPAFDQITTVGYPSFTDCLATLQLEEGQVVMGSSTPQLRWYSGCTATPFPPREELVEKLASVDWVVVVNFERGQPAYAPELINRLFRMDEAGSFQFFRDRAGHSTFAIEARELRRRLMASGG